MLIGDLPYLENVSDNEKIVGGTYLLGITSSTSAEGDNAYTLASTDVVLRNKGKKTKANGTGIALGIGEDAYADIDVYHEGFNKVKIKSKYKQRNNYAFMSVKVKAR